MKKYDIFISYRRCSYEVAMLVASQLKSAGYSVFIDMELGPGKFEEQIYNAIDNCKDFLVILTPNALDRCDDDEDWVHLEASRAMKANKNVIPIMFNGFSWPETMPAGLEELRNFQALTASNVEFFNFSMEKLKSFLKSRNRNKWNRYLLNTAIILCFLWLIGLYFKLSSPPSPEYPQGCNKYYIDFSDSLTLYSIDSCLLNRYGVENIKIIFNEAKDCIPNAQCELGNICYESGNYKDALYWYSQSAEKNGLAANGIGRCYYHAKGVGRNAQNALAWFIKSAEMHCPEGMNNAGKCYIEGIGLSLSNKKKAFEYYENAAIAGYAPAQFNLGIMYLYESGDDKYVKEGLKWLEIAAYNGSPQALLALGNIYSKGHTGIEKDLAKARKRYQEAIESGSPEVREQAEIELREMNDFVSL